MKYVISYTASRRGAEAQRVLAPDVTKDEIADDCREAALLFMNGVATGWDKVDLALWLSGFYARATRHVPRGERVEMPIEDAEPVTVAEESVVALVDRTRLQLLPALEKAAMELGELDFVDHCRSRRFVQTARLADGEPVVLAIDLPRMKLVDRVRSLFAADFCNRSYAYLDLLVCHRCESVVFDEDAKRIGHCRAHKHVSGFVPRVGVEIDRAAEGD